MKYTRKIVNLMLVVLMLTMLIVPTDVQAATAGTRNRFNVVIVLDGSNSLKSTDPNSLRHEAIGQFVNLLAENGNYLGGVVFSNHVVAQSDLVAADGQATKNQVVETLKSVAPKGYTNIGEGLNTAVDMLQTKGSKDLPSVIVFLSDGNTEMPSDEELQTSLELKAGAIQRAREAQIPIYSICLNANKKADITEMQQISAATGGQFQEVSKAEDLQNVFNTFYGLIYGTSTISLLDQKIPENGKVETEFEVPGLGVEEVNIVIYGNTKNATLYKPDGTVCNTANVTSSTFTLIKLTDIVAGKWKLVTEGVPGNSIKINMVYNADLQIHVDRSPAEDAVTTEDKVTFTATLSTGNVAATNNTQYKGYSAQLRIMDAYKEVIDTVDMYVEENHYEAEYSFKEGTYFYEVYVSGNHLEKTTEQFGPITVAKKEEPVVVNNAPEPIEKTVKETVYIWPFKGGSFSLDLTTLAKDKEDKELRYEIVSSSFFEGEDYVVEDNVIKQGDFSLRKGAYTVRATDTGGLSCDIEVVVSSVNVGILALIGIGVIAVIVLIVLGILFYIALTKPFRAQISVQSCCNGVYRGVPRNPRRGRCKLTVFQLDNIGLNYNKCYFQATGQRHIFLVTNVPVYYSGQKVNKIRIESGAEVVVSMDEAYTRTLTINFTSRMIAGRSGRSGGRRR